jgi:hypothetical protein
MLLDLKLKKEFLSTIIYLEIYNITGFKIKKGIS